MLFDMLPFACSLEHSFENLKEQSTENGLRFQGFVSALHNLMEVFRDNPGVLRVSVTSVTTAAVVKTPFSARILHHFKVDCLTPKGLPTFKIDGNEWGLRYLPYERMGSGCFVISRDDPAVQKVLALMTAEGNQTKLEDDYFGCLLTLSLAMDRAYEQCSVVHDVGFMPGVD